MRTYELLPDYKSSMLLTNLIPWEWIGRDAENLTTFLEMVDVLWRGVFEEFYDTEWSNRQHGNIKTYQAGCRGFICSRASRFVYRQKTGAAPQGLFNWVDPIIEYFTCIVEDYHEEQIRIAKKEAQSVLSTMDMITLTREYIVSESTKRAV